MENTFEYVEGYEVNNNYSEVKYFDVNLKTKKIQEIIEQPLLAGEVNSQCIGFRIPRYCDGIDLSTKDIHIIYLGPTRYRDISAVINVERNEEWVRFIWVVPAGALLDAGELMCVLEFTSEDYVLKTKANIVQVEDTMRGSEVVSEPTEQEWYHQLQSNYTEVVRRATNAEALALRSWEFAQNMSVESYEQLDSVISTTTTNNPERAIIKLFFTPMFPAHDLIGSRNFIGLTGSFSGKHSNNLLLIAIEDGAMFTYTYGSNQLVKATNSVGGTNGADGQDGADGKSAYEVAVANGFEGTEAEWLESLKGVDGKDGTDGVDGANGTSIVIENINETTEDGGSNVITFSDGQILTVKNGTKGSQGDKGDKGDSVLSLSGKTVVCFGDSLIGMYRGDDSVTDYLAQHTGATVYNVGFGGCRMSYHPYTRYDAFSMYQLANAVATNDYTLQETYQNGDNDGTVPDYFSEQVTVLNSIDFNSVDIALIHYGTNDFPSGVALDDSNNSLNCETICGALRYSIEKLLSTYPNLRLFISLPVFRYWINDDETVEYSNSYTNSNDETLVDICNAIRNVAREYNLPIIDGYHGMGVNKLNATTFLQTDGTHHTVAGRERFGTFLGAGLIAQGADLIEADTNTGGSDEEDTGGDEETSYKNQIPISVDTDGSVYGWKTNYRLTSAGSVESVTNGTELTGFIPCSFLDIIRVANMTFTTSGSSSYNRICFYDSSKTFIGCVNANAVVGSLVGQADDEGNITQFTVTNLAGADNSQCAFIRICADEIDDTSIITVNEVINEE